MRRPWRAILMCLLLLLLVPLLWLSWPRTPPPESAQAAGAGDDDGATALTLHWLGVSAVLLRAGDSAIMVDPFFTRRPRKLGLLANRRVKPDIEAIDEWLQHLGVSQLDAVAVSHSHYDHALDAGVVARRTGALLVGSKSTANIGRGAGMSEERIRVAAAGEWISAGDFRLRFHRSIHAGATGGRPRGDIIEPLVPPASALAYRQGGTWSIEIAHPHTTVLHHGSAGFEPGALENVCADTVLLGIALIDDTAAYLDAVVGVTGAQRVLAVHWDDFTRPLKPPLRPLPFGVDVGAFLDAATTRYPQVEFATLPLADPIQLPHGRCPHDATWSYRTGNISTP